MLRIVCLLLLSTYVVGHGYEGLLQKYGEKKIYESCYGSQVYAEKITEYYGWINDCEKELVKDAIANKKQPAKPTPDPSGGSDVSNQLLNLLQGQFQDGISVPGQLLLIQLPAYTEDSFRFRRHEGQSTSKAPFFTQDRIQQLMKKTKLHVDMAKCVLKKAGLLDNNDAIQWNALKQKYTDFNVADQELKADLMEVYDKCSKFATCLAPDDAAHQNKNFPMGLKQAIAFFKCQKPKTIGACCKKDLRQKPEMFDLGGLGEFMSNYDEDEQMHKILKLQHKFGTNYEAMFE